MAEALVLAGVALYVGVALYERRFGRALLAAWLVAFAFRLISDGEGASATVSWLAILGLTVIGLVYVGLRGIRKHRSAADPAGS